MNKMHLLVWLPACILGKAQIALSLARASPFKQGNLIMKTLSWLMTVLPKAPSYFNFPWKAVPAPSEISVSTLRDKLVVNQKGKTRRKIFLPPRKFASKTFLSAEHPLLLSDAKWISHFPHSSGEDRTIFSPERFPRICDETGAAKTFHSRRLSRSKCQSERMGRVETQTHVGLEGSRMSCWRAQRGCKQVLFVAFPSPLTWRSADGL